MLSGKPLFPGRDYHHQLTLILDVLWDADARRILRDTTRRSSRLHSARLPFRKKRPFSSLFPNANPLAIDFLTKTLVRGLSLLYGCHRVRLNVIVCAHRRSIPRNVSMSNRRSNILYLEAYVSLRFAFRVDGFSHVAFNVARSCG